MKCSGSFVIKSKAIKEVRTLSVCLDDKTIMYLVHSCFVKSERVTVLNLARFSAAVSTDLEVKRPIFCVLFILSLNSYECRNEEILPTSQ